ncbi:hypothetical protein B0H16DRAFT_1532635, partial [Mycena metata]
MNLSFFRPQMVENTGSAARDYCMLERNILSHFKLALLLSLLSSSVLLKARLVPDPDNKPANLSGTTGIVIACLQFTAALLAIGAGVWEYYCGYRDIRNMHAFLVAVKCASILRLDYPTYRRPGPILQSLVSLLQWCFSLALLYWQNIDRQMSRLVHPVLLASMCLPAISQPFTCAAEQPTVVDSLVNSVHIPPNCDLIEYH